MAHDWKATELMDDLLNSEFGPSWDRWRVFLKAVDGQPLTPEELSVFRHHTARELALAREAREAFACCGRGAGKSRISGLVLVSRALRDYLPHLARGEWAHAVCLASDRIQSRIVLRYVKGIFEHELLRQMVDRDTEESLFLKNRVLITVATRSFRGIRGPRIVCAVLDELAYWRNEDTGSLNPDIEIFNALRPSLARTPGSLLLAISSPYAKSGVLWDAYRRTFGKDDPDTLFWKGTTLEMNPLFDAATVDRALQEDASVAKAEYLAEFRDDLETYVPWEVIQAAVIPDRSRLPYQSGVLYFAFVDPSGGSGSDAMTLAIAHNAGRKGFEQLPKPHPVLGLNGDPLRWEQVRQAREKLPESGRIVIDDIMEWTPPFSPEACVAEFSARLKEYRISSLTGDRFAGEWPREQFRRYGIEYRISDLPKSQIYQNALPLLNSRQIELPYHKKLIRQFLNLERRTGSSGRDVIDHGKSKAAHDDLCNAVCGAALLAVEPQRGWRMVKIVGF